MKKQQKNPFNSGVKLTALFTAFFFTINNLTYGATNLPQSPQPSSSDSQAVVNQSLNDRSWVENLQLPETLGQIKSSFQGNREGVVIHIQDAHINEEAQLNIGKILDYFASQHGLKWVNLEGADGELFTDLFSFFPRKEARKKIADYFLKEGRLSGPEYLAIVHRPDIKLYGVEDRAVYEENRQAYLKAQSFKSRDEELLASLGKLLENVSRYVFSDELRELNQRSLNFQEGGHELVGYVNYLLQSARKNNIELVDYPGMHSLLSLVEIEGQIDFEKAEKEIDQFSNDLRKILSREKLSRYLTNTVQFRMRKMKRADYYGYLQEEIEGVSPESGDAKALQTRYGNVLSYLKYMRLYDSIGVQLFDEIEKLETVIKNKLFRNPQEVELDRIMRIHSVSQKMFEFTLTKQDADFFYTYRKDFKAATFRDFLEPVLKTNKFSYGIPDGLDQLDKDLPEVELFYAAALKRDRVLIQRAMDKMQEENQKVTALVTGGFHTPGIEKYLREHDYSYIVIAPRISKAIDEQAESLLYNNALAQKPLPLEKGLIEAFFPQRTVVLNDPRFQLAAWHLVISRGAEGIQFVKALSESADAGVDIQSLIKSSPAKAQAVLALILLAAENMMQSQYPDAIQEAMQKSIAQRFLPEEVSGLTAFVEKFSSGVVEDRGNKGKILWLPQAGRENRYTAIAQFPQGAIAEIRNKLGLRNGVQQIALPSGENILVASQVDSIHVPDAVVEKLKAKAAAPRSELRIAAVEGDVYPYLFQVPSSKLGEPPIRFQVSKAGKLLFLEATDNLDEQISPQDRVTLGAMIRTFKIVQTLRQTDAPQNAIVDVKLPQTKTPAGLSRYIFEVPVGDKIKRITAEIKQPVQAVHLEMSARLINQVLGSVNQNYEQLFMSRTGLNANDIRGKKVQYRSLGLKYSPQGKPEAIYFELYAQKLDGEEVVVPVVLADQQDFYDWSMGEDWPKTADSKIAEVAGKKYQLGIFKTSDYAAIASHFSLENREAFLNEEIVPLGIGDEVVYDRALELFANVQNAGYADQANQMIQEAEAWVQEQGLNTLMSRSQLDRLNVLREMAQQRVDYFVSLSLLQNAQLAINSEDAQRFRTKALELFNARDLKAVLDQNETGIFNASLKKADQRITYFQILSLIQQSAAAGSRTQINALLDQARKLYEKDDLEQFISATEAADLKAGVKKANLRKIYLETRSLLARALRSENLQEINDLLGSARERLTDAVKAGLSAGELKRLNDGMAEVQSHRIALVAKSAPVEVVPVPLSAPESAAVVPSAPPVAVTPVSAPVLPSVQSPVQVRESWARWLFPRLISLASISIGAFGLAFLLDNKDKESTKEKALETKRVEPAVPVAPVSAKPSVAVKIPVVAPVPASVRTQIPGKNPETRFVKTVAGVRETYVYPGLIENEPLDKAGLARVEKQGAEKAEIEYYGTSKANPLQRIVQSNDGKGNILQEAFVYQEAEGVFYPVQVELKNPKGQILYRQMLGFSGAPARTDFFIYPADQILIKTYSGIHTSEPSDIKLLEEVRGYSKDKELVSIERYDPETQLVQEKEIYSIDAAKKERIKKTYALSPVVREIPELGIGDQRLVSTDVYDLQGNPKYRWVHGELEKVVNTTFFLPDGNGGFRSDTFRGELTQRLTNRDDLRRYAERIFDEEYMGSLRDAANRKGIETDAILIRIKQEFLKTIEDKTTARDIDRKILTAVQDARNEIASTPAVTPSRALPPTPEMLEKELTLASTTEARKKEIQVLIALQRDPYLKFIHNSLEAAIGRFLDARIPGDDSARTAVKQVLLEQRQSFLEKAEKIYAQVYLELSGGVRLSPEKEIELRKQASRLTAAALAGMPDLAALPDAWQAKAFITAQQKFGAYRYTGLDRDFAGNIKPPIVIQSEFIFSELQFAQKQWQAQVASSIEGLLTDAPVLYLQLEGLKPAAPKPLPGIATALPRPVVRTPAPAPAVNPALEQKKMADELLKVLGPAKSGFAREFGVLSANPNIPSDADILIILSLARLYPEDDLNKILYQGDGSYMELYSRLQELDKVRTDEPGLWNTRRSVPFRGLLNIYEDTTKELIRQYPSESNKIKNSYAGEYEVLNSHLTDMGARLMREKERLLQLAMDRGLISKPALLPKLVAPESPVSAPKAPAVVEIPALITFEDMLEASFWRLNEASRIAEILKQQGLAEMASHKPQVGFMGRLGVSFSFFFQNPVLEAGVGPDFAIWLRDPSKVPQANRSKLLEALGQIAKTQAFRDHVQKIQGFQLRYMMAVQLERFYTEKIQETQKAYDANRKVLGPVLDKTSEGYRLILLNYERDRIRVKESKAIILNEIRAFMGIPQGQPLEIQVPEKWAAREEMEDLQKKNLLLVVEKSVAPALPAVAAVLEPALTDAGRNDLAQLQDAVKQVTPISPLHYESARELIAAKEKQYGVKLTDEGRPIEEIAAAYEAALAGFNAQLASAQRETHVKLSGNVLFPAAFGLSLQTIRDRGVVPTMTLFDWQASVDRLTGLTRQLEFVRDQSRQDMQSALSEIVQLHKEKDKAWQTYQLIQQRMLEGKASYADVVERLKDYYAIVERIHQQHGRMEQAVLNLVTSFRSVDVQIKSVQDLELKAKQAFSSDAQTGDQAANDLLNILKNESEQVSPQIVLPREVLAGVSEQEVFERVYALVNQSWKSSEQLSAIKGEIGKSNALLNVILSRVIQQDEEFSAKYPRLVELIHGRGGYLELWTRHMQLHRLGSEKPAFWNTAHNRIGKLLTRETRDLVSGLGREMRLTTPGYNTDPEIKKATDLKIREMGREIYTNYRNEEKYLRQYLRILSGKIAAEQGRVLPVVLEGVAVEERLTPRNEWEVASTRLGLTIQQFRDRSLDPQLIAADYARQLAEVQKIRVQNQLLDQFRAFSLALVQARDRVRLLDQLIADETAVVRRLNLALEKKEEGSEKLLADIEVANQRLAKLEIEKREASQQIEDGLRSLKSLLGLRVTDALKLDQIVGNTESLESLSKALGEMYSRYYFPEVNLIDAKLKQAYASAFVEAARKAGSRGINLDASVVGAIVDIPLFEGQEKKSFTLRTARAEAYQKYVETEDTLVQKRLIEARIAGEANVRILERDIQRSLESLDETRVTLGRELILGSRNNDRDWNLKADDFANALRTVRQQLREASEIEDPEARNRMVSVILQSLANEFEKYQLFDANEINFPGALAHVQRIYDRLVPVLAAVDNQSAPLPTTSLVSGWKVMMARNVLKEIRLVLNAKAADLASARALLSTLPELSKIPLSSKVILDSEGRVIGIQPTGVGGQSDLAALGISAAKARYEILVEQRHTQNMFARFFGTIGAPFTVRGPGSIEDHLAFLDRTSTAPQLEASQTVRGQVGVWVPFNPKLYRAGNGVVGVPGGLYEVALHAEARFPLYYLADVDNAWLEAGQEVRQNAMAAFQDQREVLDAVNQLDRSNNHYEEALYQFALRRMDLAMVNKRIPQVEREAVRDFPDIASLEEALRRSESDVEKTRIALQRDMNRVLMVLDSKSPASMPELIRDLSGLLPNQALNRIRDAFNRGTGDEALRRMIYESLGDRTRNLDNMHETFRRAVQGDDAKLQALIEMAKQANKARQAREEELKPTLTLISLIGFPYTFLGGQARVNLADGGLAKAEETIARLRAANSFDRALNAEQNAIREIEDAVKRLASAAEELSRAGKAQNEAQERYYQAWQRTVTGHYNEEDFRKWIDQHAQARNLYVEALSSLRQRESEFYLLLDRYGIKSWMQEQVDKQVASAPAIAKPILPFQEDLDRWAWVKSAEGIDIRPVTVREIPVVKEEKIPELAAGRILRRPNLEHVPGLTTETPAAALQIRDAVRSVSPFLAEGVAALFGIEQALPAELKPYEAPVKSLLDAMQTPYGPNYRLKLNDWIRNVFDKYARNYGLTQETMIEQIRGMEATLKILQRPAKEIQFASFPVEDQAQVKALLEFIQERHARDYADGKSLLDIYRKMRAEHFAKLRSEKSMFSIKWDKFYSSLLDLETVSQLRLRRAPEGIFDDTDIDLSLAGMLNYFTSKTRAGGFNPEKEVPLNFAWILYDMDFEQTQNRPVARGPVLGQSYVQWLDQRVKDFDEAERVSAGMTGDKWIDLNMRMRKVMDVLYPEGLALYGDRKDSGTLGAWTLNLVLNPLVSDLADPKEQQIARQNIIAIVEALLRDPKKIANLRGFYGDVPRDLVLNLKESAKLKWVVEKELPALADQLAAFLPESLRASARNQYFDLTPAEESQIDPARKGDFNKLLEQYRLLNRWALAREREAVEALILGRTNYWTRWVLESTAPELKGIRSNLGKRVLTSNDIEAIILPAIKERLDQFGKISKAVNFVLVSAGHDPINVNDDQDLGMLSAFLKFADKNLRYDGADSDKALGRLDYILRLYTWENTAAIKKLIARLEPDYPFNLRRPRDMGRLTSSTMGRLLDGRNFTQDRFNAMIAVLDTIGRDKAFAEAEKFWEAFDRAVEADFHRAISGKYSAWDVEREGRFMSFLQQMAAEVYGSDVQKGVNKWIEKSNRAVAYFNNAEKVDQALQRAGDLYSALLGLPSGSIKLTRENVQKDEEKHAIFVSWIVAAASEPGEPQKVWDAWLVLNEGMVDLFRQKDLGVEKRIILARLAIKESRIWNPDSYAEIKTDDDLQEALKTDSRLQGKVFALARDVIDFGADKTSGSWKQWLERRTAVIETLQDQFKRQLILDDAQKLSNFHQDGVKLDLRRDLVNSTRIQGLLTGWGEFRSGFYDTANESWRKTEGVADRVIEILKSFSKDKIEMKEMEKREEDEEDELEEEDAEIEDLGEAAAKFPAAAPLNLEAAGTLYLESVARLYFYERGYSAEESLRRSSSMKKIENFQSDDDAWNFLIGMTSALVLDLKGSAVKSSESEIAQMAYHAANIWFVMQDIHAPDDPNSMGELLKKYYTLINRPNESFDTQANDRVERRRVWGEIVGRIKTIEELNGRYQLSGDEIRKTMLDLLHVQEAANAKWRRIRMNSKGIPANDSTGPSVQLEDQAVNYYYRLFYTARQENAINIPSYIDVTNENYAQFPEKFFDYVNFAQRLRLKAADGDLDILPEREGLLPLLERFQSDSSFREKAPEWAWLEGEDLKGSFERPGLIDLIAGNSERGIKEGLRNQPIRDPEAVQFFNTFLEENGAWPGFSSAKKKLLARAWNEMLLQAVFMRYHRNENGESRRLELADLSSWNHKIERGVYSVEEAALILKYDGIFQDLERETIAALGQDSSYPVFAQWERLGFIEQMLNRGWDLARLKSWFADVRKVQAAAKEYLHHYIDPNQISYAVTRFQKEGDLNLLREFQMKRFLSTVGQKDPSFRDLGNAGNETRRLIFTWRTVFNQIPGESEISGGLKWWKDVSDLYREYPSAVDMEAVQREFIERLQMTDRTFVESAGDIFHRLGAIQMPLLENRDLNAVSAQVRDLLTTPLRSTGGAPVFSKDTRYGQYGPLQVLMRGLADREARMKEIRTQKIQETEVLDSVWRTIEERREQRKGKLPEGKTEAEIRESLQARYEAYFQSLSPEDQSRLTKRLSVSSLDVMISKMRELGYSEEEAFVRFEVIKNEAVKAYLFWRFEDSRYLPPSPEAFAVLNNEELAVVSSFADAIFKTWGITEPSDVEKVQRGLETMIGQGLRNSFWPKTIEDGIREDIKRLKKTLQRAKQIQSMLQDVIGKRITDEKARLMADSSINSGIEPEEIEVWVRVAARLQDFIRGLKMSNGQTVEEYLKTLPEDQINELNREIQIQALYLADSWLKIGLAPLPRERKWNVDEILPEVRTQFARIAEAQEQDSAAVSRLLSRWLANAEGEPVSVTDPGFQSRVAQEMVNRNVSPVQLRLLTEEVLQTKNRMKTAIAQETQRPINDPIRTASGLPALSTLDLLFHYDHSVAGKSKRMGLLNLIRSGEKSDSSVRYWTKNIENGLTDIDRAQSEDVLRGLGFEEAEQLPRTTSEWMSRLKDRLTSFWFAAPLAAILGLITVVTSLFRAVIYREGIRKGIWRTVTSEHFVAVVATLTVGALILPEVIIALQAMPVLAVALGLAWAGVYLVFNLVLDNTVRKASYMGENRLIGFRFLLYRIERALLAGGALFLTLWYIGVMNPVALVPLAGIVSFLITYALLAVVWEVGAVKFIGNILLGSKRPKEKTSVSGQVAGRRSGAIENAVPNESPDAQKLRVQRNLEKTGQVLQVVMPYYISKPSAPAEEEDDVRKAVTRLSQSVEGNDHSNIVGVLLLNTPRISDPAFLAMVSRVIRETVPAEAQKRFSVVLRPGVVKPINYQLLLWWQRNGQNTFDAATQPEWFSVYTNKQGKFFDGYLDYADGIPDSDRIKDFNAAPNAHPISKIKYDTNLKGTPAEWTVITDADNYLDTDSAWPLLDTMMNAAPEVSSQDGAVTNHAPLFIQPAVKFHNAEDTLWAAAHDQAQESLWYFQRFMSTSTGGVRGFGKFAFHTNQYVDVMLKPYPGAGYDQGRYENIVQHTELWNKWLTESQAKLNDMANGKILKPNGTAYTQGEVDTEARSVRQLAIQKLTEFLKSEDEIHTNAVNQSGSYIALLDDNPGAAWGTIAAGLGVLAPVAALVLGLTLPVWSAIVAGTLGVVWLLNKIVHRSSVQTPRILNLIAASAVAIAAFWIFSTFSFAFLPVIGLTVAAALLSSVAINFLRPEVRGSIIREGFPSDVKEEEEREIKWIGTFDIPNMWARAQHAVGKDPATAFYNDLVERGIWSEQKWALLLIVGYVSVLVPGILEVSLPFLAEANFVTVMLLLLHVKFSGAVMRFFNEIGRPGNNPIASLFILFFDLAQRVVELVLSTLIYLNKLFIKSPLVLKSLLGLRAQLAGGANPWKVANQLFTVRSLTEYLSIYPIPFAVGVNAFVVFTVSAGGFAGASLAIGAGLTLFMAWMTYSVVKYRWQQPIQDTTDAAEKARMQAKWKQVFFRVPTVLFLAGGLYLFLAAQPVIGTWFIGGAALTFVLNWWNNYFIAKRIENAARTAAIGKIPAADKARPVLGAEKEKWAVRDAAAIGSKILTEETLGSILTIALYVPFAVSFLFLFQTPVIASVLDWDWVLRASPLFLTFLSGPFAAHLASFRFYPDTDKGNARNAVMIKVLSGFLGIATVAGAVALMDIHWLAPLLSVFGIQIDPTWAFSDYLNHTPILSQSPGADGTVGLYSPLLRIPTAFTFLHATIIAGTVVIVAVSILLAGWRFISGFTPKVFGPFRLVQRGEERQRSEIRQQSARQEVAMEEALKLAAVSVQESRFDYQRRLELFREEAGKVNQTLDKVVDKMVADYMKSLPATIQDGPQSLIIEVKTAGDLDLVKNALVQTRDLQAALLVMPEMKQAVDTWKSGLASESALRTHLYEGISLRDVVQAESQRVFQRVENIDMATQVMMEAELLKNLNEVEREGINASTLKLLAPARMVIFSDQGAIELPGLKTSILPLTLQRIQAEFQAQEKIAASA